MGYIVGSFDSLSLVLGNIGIAAPERIFNVHNMQYEDQRLIVKFTQAHVGWLVIAIDLSRDEFSFGL